MEYIFLAGIGLFIALLINFGIHKIDEGHVGVYYRFGSLLQVTSEPGFNLQLPFITSYQEVQISVQTDQVTNIPCGTSGGVVIFFDKIEVVNQLRKKYVLETIRNYTIDYDRIWIYDKIHHEINQFCSKHSLQEVFIDLFDSLDESLMAALQSEIKNWAPGIEILSIRVTKPIIPEGVKQNFELMEEEKTKLLIVTEKQKVRIQEKETKRKQLLIKANSEFEITKINIEKQLKDKENQLSISRIENEIFLSKEKSLVDAEYYKSKKELETIKQKLTQQYLAYLNYDSLTNNLILYLGDDIPNSFCPNNWQNFQK